MANYYIKLIASNPPRYLTWCEMQPEFVKKSKSIKYEYFEDAMSDLNTLLYEYGIYGTVVCELKKGESNLL